MLLDYAEDAEEYKKNNDFEKVDKIEDYKSKIEALENELAINKANAVNAQKFYKGDERLENERLKHEVASLHNIIKDLTEENNKKKKELINLVKDKAIKDEREQLLKTNAKLNYEINHLKRMLEESNKKTIFNIEKRTIQTSDNTLNSYEAIVKSPKTHSPLITEHKEIKFNQKENIKLENYKIECEQLKNQLANLNQEHAIKIKKLNNELFNTQANLQTTRKAHTQLENDYEKLKSDFSNTKKISCLVDTQTLQNLTNENRELSRQLESERDSYDKMMQKLHEELDTANKEKEEKDKSLNEAYELLDKTRNEVNNLKNDITLAEDNTNKLNEIIDQFKTELNLRVTTITEYESKVKDLNEEHKKLNMKIEGASDKSKQLATELTTQKTKNEGLNKELQNYKREVVKLKEKCKKMEDKMLIEEKEGFEVKAKQGVVLKRIQSLEQENQELHSQINKGLVELEAANTELDIIKPSFANLQHIQFQYNLLQKQHEELSTEIREAMYKIKEIIRYISIKYKDELMPLCNAEFVFPDIDVHNNVARQIVESFNTYKDLIDYIIGEFKITTQNIVNTKEELKNMKAINDELEELMKVKLKVISINRDKERQLLNDNRGLQSKIVELQREQERLVIEYVHILILIEKISLKH